MLGYHGHAVRVSYPHFIRFTVSLDLPCLPVCTGGNIALKRPRTGTSKGTTVYSGAELYLQHTPARSRNSHTCRVEKWHQIHWLQLPSATRLIVNLAVFDCEREMIVEHTTNGNPINMAKEANHPT
jgi:hypothetical protein